MNKELNKTLYFPDNFLWGTSTSAYQIEGGIENDWSEFEKLEVTRLAKARSRRRSKKFPPEAGQPRAEEVRNFNLKNFVCDRACDSYNRYEEDFDLAVGLNNNAHRLSIEWSRIEPREGKWNMEEIKHYRKVLQALKKRNLKIILTLWHWTNPLWLSKQGGWANKKVIGYFSRYTDLVVKELGEYIDYWVTLNEPIVHVANGYVAGKFPPNKKNIFKANKVFNNLAKAHNKSYEIIHNNFPKARVSITKLTNYFEPARKWCLPEVWLAKIFHYFWNDRFLRKIKNNIDYIGLDYYFHDRVVWYPPFRENLNKQTTDMGWDIYPEGIYHVLKYLRKVKKPIIVLENGLADEKDNKRADFIVNHLKYIHKAMQEGADARGYFYWSLLDNFEWTHGFEPKFGLYAVDRETFERTARGSTEIYGKICKENRIELV